jgi:hypothetical protein
MRVATKTISQVLQEAEERLKIVRFGLADMNNPERARAGLYGAVVFGRMVTFALPNLRGVIPDFDG